VIKRGYDHLCKFKRVLVVEDILTTGGSVKKVIETARAIPAEVIGVAALCNRGNLTSQELGNVPDLFVLANITLDAWDEKDCPLCKKGVPINTDVGKGLEYQTKIITRT
jgi:orotate phosphoribosyltransferase